MANSRPDATEYWLINCNKLQLKTLIKNLGLTKTEIK